MGSTTVSTASGHSYPGSLKSLIRIDCSSGECVVTTLTIDDTPDHAGIIDMSQGHRLVLVDGKGSFPLPAYGNPCGTVYIGTGTLTLTATATTFTGVRTSAGYGHRTCPDGSEVYSADATFTATATLSGGNPCVLDSTCPTPKPTATPTASALPSAAGSNYQPPKATHFSSPTTLSALPTTKTALTFRGILWSAAIAVVLVLLIAFPTHLLNATTEEGANKVRE
jgi:hypothetical protein